jgi:hypothetical protein
VDASNKRSAFVLPTINMILKSKIVKINFSEWFLGGA